MMRFNLAVLYVGALTGIVSAQNSFTSMTGTPLSAVRNPVGLHITQSKYQVGFNRLQADTPLFLNQVSIVPGSAFDPALGLQVGTPGGFGTIRWFGQQNGVDTNGDYVLGTELSGDLNIVFLDLVGRTGAVDPAVSIGMYDFQVQLLGGGSSTATDLLGAFDYQIEVVDSIVFSGSATMSPGTIGLGEQSLASATLENIGGRTLITNGLFAQVLTREGSPFTSQSFLSLDSFVSTGANNFLGPGQSVSTPHSIWRSRPDNLLGTYSGPIGFVGGLYSGDSHFLTSSVVRVEVVPEPATLGALGLGLVALLRRRSVG